MQGRAEEGHAPARAIEDLDGWAVHAHDGARLGVALGPGADAAAVGHEDKACRAVEQAPACGLAAHAEQVGFQGRAVVDHASDLACAAVVDPGVRLGHGHLAKAVLAQCAQAWLGRARDVTQELPGSATAANPEMAACAGRADGNAPAVDEVGFREARAVASMAGEQGCLEVAVGGCAAAAGGQGRGGEGAQNKMSPVEHVGFSGGMAKRWMGWLSMRNQGAPDVLAAACEPGGPQI